MGGFPWAKNDGVTSLKLGLFDTDQGYDYEVDDEDEDYTVGVKVEEDDQGKVAVEGVPSVAGASGGKKEGRSLRVSTPSAAPGLNRLGSVSQKSNHSPNGARRRRSILKMERLKRMKRPRTSSQLALQSGGSQQASLAFLISGNDETGDENASAFRTISRSVTATDQPSQLSRTFSTGVFRATSISRMKPSVGESMVHVTSSLNSSAESEVAALNVTSMAFDMLAVIKYLSYPGIEMRIGIHTGNIIAGIIGTKQLRYDIWGTDCLIANSLESHGIPSGIVISRSTANYVKEYYALVPREDIVLKGRGGKSENGQSVRVTNFGIHYPYDFPEKILNIGKY